jgi:hypothetical protein
MVRVYVLLFISRDGIKQSAQNMTCLCRESRFWKGKNSGNCPRFGAWCGWFLQLGSSMIKDRRHEHDLKEFFKRTRWWWEDEHTE